MVIFSHRGIGFGKKENSLEAISSAVSKGFSVELDLRLLNNKIVLSHDTTDSTDQDEAGGLGRIIKENPQTLFALHLKEDSEALFERVAVLIRPFSNCIVFVTDFMQDRFIEYVFSKLGKQRLALYTSDYNLDKHLIEKVSYLWLDESLNDIYGHLDHFYGTGKKLILCSPELFKKECSESLQFFKKTLSSQSKNIFGICTDFPGEVINRVIELEEIPCPICAGNEHKIIFKSGDFRFHTDANKFGLNQCLKCGFRFLSPRPAAPDMALFYPSDFNRRDTTLPYRIFFPFFRLAQASTVKLFKKYKFNAKTLDVGCGNGEFVSVMLKEGYDAFGVEPNHQAAAFADKSLAGRILYKDIWECGFSEKTFDIITMFQSLEHVYRPEKLFNELKRIIKPGGLLYICVPNNDFFEFLLFGPYAYNLEIPRHLYFFNRRTLANFLSKLGFKPELYLKDYLSEFVSTPASIFHSVCYFFEDKGMPINKFIKIIIYLPLIILKLILRFLFFSQGQNLKFLCRKI